VKALRISESELLSVSPPGSRHLRGLRFTPSLFARLGTEGHSTYLFRPGKLPSKAALRYIEHGQELGVDQAYKCRVRKPWWQVPVLTPPDLFLTYMNADTPRLAANQAGVHHLNSVHGVYLKSELKKLATALAVASVNSATMLGAEIAGRSYGGGILKLEPGESANLPMPSVDLVRRHESDLRRLAQPMIRLLRRGNLLGAAALVDDCLLRQGAGVTDEDLTAMREGLEVLSMRRATRAASGRNPRMST
jgi:hypothetical protein